MIVLAVLALLQLYGGIQRYLEQFPDGGFFRGKNFVFDHRYGFVVCQHVIVRTLLISYLLITLGW